MGLDLVTMAATISKLTASGQIGYGKALNPVTFNGEINGLENMPMSELFALYRISDNLIDVKKVESVMLSSNGQEDNKITSDKITAMNMEGVGVILVPYGDATDPITAVMSVPANNAESIPEGLYVLCSINTYTDNGKEKAQIYLSSINFAKEVKPIDPKYLPGIPIPELRLSEATAGALLQAGSATLTAEESAALDEALMNEYPVVVSAKMQGVLMFNSVAQLGYNLATYTPHYSLLINGYVTDGTSTAIKLTLLIFNKTAGGWEASSVVSQFPYA